MHRARDTKLHRDVALKVLPNVFANDPDRLARFTREAQTQRFLVLTPVADEKGVSAPPLTVVLNWAQALKR